MSTKESKSPSSSQGKRDSKSLGSSNPPSSPSNKKEHKPSEKKEKSLASERSTKTDQKLNESNPTSESPETEEELEIIVDKEGPLSMMKSKHWKDLHFTLSGSALYARKHEGVVHFLFFCFGNLENS
jgi:hypothetical protein